MTTEDVVVVYQRLNSIRATARALSISHTVVRKCLITHSMLTNPYVQTIDDLKNQGMSCKEIAERLGMSKSWVDANSKYTRGTYFTTPKTKKCGSDS